MPAQEASLLDVLKRCQNDNPWTDPSLHPFLVDGVQIGFLPASVFDAVSEYLREDLDGAKAFQVRDGDGGRLPAITFRDECGSREARTKQMGRLALWLRHSGKFPDPLDGWRDEQYAVYGPDPSGKQRSAVSFSLERSVCALFGLATIGVHLTAYTPDGRIWVPKRSKTKQTWPGYYDNSVAGGITAGDGPMESMIRECGEEAGLPADLVAKHIKQTGVVTYFYKTPLGWRQPEVQFTYDLALPSDEIQLRPGDGEAESFELLDAETIKQRMSAGKFKANCCLVLLDFFARHGILTYENERDYFEIVSLLHTPLSLPCP